MESITDLLQLPSASDFQDDKWYKYDSNLSTWEAAKMLRTYDYEWIGRLEIKLKYNSELLARLAKGANQVVRIQRAQADRRRLEKRRDLLVSGWERIKTNLQPISLQLLALPIEIRDHIYSHLYTRPNSIIIDYPEFESNGRMLPRDPYYYMNASVVDPRIAVEAATTFYQTNSFSFSTSNSEHISRFLSTDHYCSGVEPAAILRRIALALTDVRYYSYGYSRDYMSSDNPNTHDFETSLRQRMAFYPSVFRTRNFEVPLLAMPELCVLDVSISKSFDGDLRELAPLLKRLRRRDVRVRVSLKWVVSERGTPSAYELNEVPGRVYLDGRDAANPSIHPNDQTHGLPGGVCVCADISRLFDDPSDEDRELVKEHGERLKRHQNVKQEDLKLWFAKGRTVYEEQLDICERLDARENESRRHS